MSKKYLDLDGLSAYDQKIKEYIDDGDVTIDNTLTQAGQAADAKKTGDELTDLKSAIIETAPTYYKEAQGHGGTGITNILGVEDAVARKVKSLVVDLGAVQAGSGDPSPENIREFTGWNQTVICYGKGNLFDLSQRQTGKGINSNGNIYASPNYQISGNISLNGAKNVRYIYYNSAAGYRTSRINYYRADGSFISKREGSNTASKNYRVESITNIPAETNYYIVEVPNNTTYVAVIADYSVKGYTYESPIYGGKLDVTGGTLTVTHGYIASYDGEELPGKWASSMDVYAEGTTPTAGAQVVYELAAPVVSNVEAMDIVFAEGKNCVMAYAAIPRQNPTELLYPCGTDRSLKVDGVPADAKTVGDKFNDTHDTIEELSKTGYLNWTDGNINTQGQTYDYSTPRAVSQKIAINRIFTATADRNTFIHCYDINNSYLGGLTSSITLNTSGYSRFTGDLPIDDIKSKLNNVFYLAFAVIPEDGDTGNMRVFGLAHLKLNLKDTPSSVAKWLENARYVANNTDTTPLTLLHISDIHANAAALARINDKVKLLGNMINGRICTGDQTYNVAGSIASWWDPSYMTVIGNHDTRIGDNWTGLSVADRIANYIAPFESGWGITRPSDCSYYYKDYSREKVRLIVLDAMLYVSGGSDATAQTAWLGDLMDGAIANSLHVLIATHAPHDGSTAYACTFSSATATTYSGNASICDLPQSVINLVAEKITGGCKFIGYIVGHTHRDGIWKATEDGRQLMYCITCATDTLNGDQCREVSFVAANKNSAREFMYSEGAYYDAANLVTIDTVHSLIKIVRVGGADRDVYMRPREAICFRYLDGTLMGEAK